MSEPQVEQAAFESNLPAVSNNQGNETRNLVKQRAVAMGDELSSTDNSPPKVPEKMKHRPIPPPKPKNQQDNGSHPGHKRNSFHDAVQRRAAERVEKLSSTDKSPPKVPVKRKYRQNAENNQEFDPRGPVTKIKPRVPPKPNGLYKPIVRQESDEEWPAPPPPVEFSDAYIVSEATGERPELKDKVNQCAAERVEKPNYRLSTAKKSPPKVPEKRKKLRKPKDYQVSNMERCNPTPPKDPPTPEAEQEMPNFPPPSPVIFLDTTDELPNLKPTHDEPLMSNNQQGKTSKYPRSVTVFSPSTVYKRSAKNKPPIPKKPSATKTKENVYINLWDCSSNTQENNCNLEKVESEPKKNKSYQGNGNTGEPIYAQLDWSNVGQPTEAYALKESTVYSKIRRPDKQQIHNSTNGKPPVATPREKKGNSHQEEGEVMEQKHGGIGPAQDSNWNPIGMRPPPLPPKPNRNKLIQEKIPKFTNENRMNSGDQKDDETFEIIRPPKTPEKKLKQEKVGQFTKEDGSSGNEKPPLTPRNPDKNVDNENHIMNEGGASKKSSNWLECCKLPWQKKVDSQVIANEGGDIVFNYQ
ncbi:Caspase recruitment domain, member 6 [Cichlidogyrus casuarinus]|uniref:Caspase recruitment domain, member 6 n=1 Tax=Cichlidogyrus casuarinus TaxID=1844966 RepID=A0ABD2PLQ3_9PLAT